MIESLRAAVGTAHVEEGAPLTVWPGAAADLSEVLRAVSLGKARAQVGGAAGTAEVRIDLSRMKQVLHVDETSLLAHVQAGITLEGLEVELAPRGITLGPIARASRGRTVGAMLAAPRPSEGTPRGRFVASCAALDAVLADGTLIHTRLAPRRATGPDLAQALVGARGATGIITGAWLRCERHPPSLRHLALAFADGDRAIECACALLSRGARPADLSVLDGELADGEPLLAIRFAGTREVTEAEAALALELGRAGRVADESLAERWLGPRREAARGERFVRWRDLASAFGEAGPRAELTALSPAGAALIDDRPPPPLPSLSALDLALARALDPDATLARP